MGYESYSVLVIEDDPAYRKLLHRIVEDRVGARCCEAGNPIEAFLHFAESIPDLIICDLLLPEMHGLTAIERLRQSSTTRNIPILICSSAADREMLLRLAALGVKDFLLKPLQSLLVVDKIKELLPAPVDVARVAQPALKPDSAESSDVWI